MRSTIVSIFLVFCSGCIGKPQTQQELKAIETIEIMKEMEEKENISPVEKKLERQIARELRYFDRCIKEGKNYKQALDSLRSLYIFDNKDRVFVRVRIKRDKENEKEQVKLFIEAQGGEIHSSDRDVLFHYFCFLPFEALQKIAGLDAVALITRMYAPVHNKL